MSCRKRRLYSYGCHRPSTPPYCKICPDCFNIVLTLLKKYALVALRCVMSALDVLASVCVLCLKISMMQNMHSIISHMIRYIIIQIRIMHIRRRGSSSKFLDQSFSKKRQSLHQIYSTHQDEIVCSKKTLYNYLEAGLFDVRNGDLPRRARFCPRKQKKGYKVDKGCHIG